MSARSRRENIRPIAIRAAGWLVLALALVSGMLAAPGFVRAEGDINVALLVVFSDRTETYCLQVPDGVAGSEVLEASGLRIVKQVNPGLGAAICKIEDTGCDYPGEDCFCDCMGSPCEYWNYWYWEGDAWVHSPMGASNRTVSDGALEAWVWGLEDQVPPVTGFASVCEGVVATETPIAPTATAEPTRTPVPTLTPAPTETTFSTQTPLPTDTPYGGPTPTLTPTPTLSSTPTPSPTITRTPTRTLTPTRTPTPNGSMTATRTRTPTRTGTPTVTATNTPVPAVTSTYAGPYGGEPTNTVYVEYTNTPWSAYGNATSTPYYTRTRTPTRTRTRTRTPTRTRTKTPTGPTRTPTPGPSPTPTVTGSATPTALAATPTPPWPLPRYPVPDATPTAFGYPPAGAAPTAPAQTLVAVAPVKPQGGQAGYPQPYTFPEAQRESVSDPAPAAEIEANLPAAKAAPAHVSADDPSAVMVRTAVARSRELRSAPPEPKRAPEPRDPHHYGVYAALMAVLGLIGLYIWAVRRQRHRGRGMG